jgi:endonuclease/exonuclease/phosphatase family metal-dependent hydrolase
MTPPFRLDLWSPACWQAYRANRKFQHAQMSGIAQQIAALPRDVPIVAGGDWNAPAGDAVFSTLQPRLYDTFSEAGRGWGNTITNEFPVLRIDQIWASSQWRTSTVVARKTQHSDHRMVICDLQLAAP